MSLIMSLPNCACIGSIIRLPSILLLHLGDQESTFLSNNQLPKFSILLEKKTIVFKSLTFKKNYINEIYFSIFPRVKDALKCFASCSKLVLTNCTCIGNARYLHNKTLWLFS